MLASVEELVIQYQDGRDNDIFNAIYAELLPMKQVLVRKLRKCTPSAISDADVETFYEDAIYICAAKFSADKGCSFKTFVSMKAEDMRMAHIRALNAEKRQADATAVSMDTLIADSSEMRVVDMIADTSATDPVELLTGSEILDKLQSFMAVNAKNHTAGALIALDTVYFTSREEKHTAVQKMLGAELSTSGIHKKIQRAKIAFQKYLEEN